MTKQGWRLEALKAGALCSRLRRAKKNRVEWRPRGITGRVEDARIRPER